MRTIGKTLLQLALVGAPLVAFAQAPAPPATTAIQIDATAPATPFPHFWEQTFGSGRAILSLRDEYRQDLDTVHAATGFESVRFHGILMDEVGLYDPNRKSMNPGQKAEEVTGAAAYNFSYVDQIYDGLLEHHVRPFVELSFMPKQMASDPAALHGFWYHPNVSPPKDYKLWDAMISALAQHLVERYGIDEVAHWNFEVWNEPNLDFWAGKPAQASYWMLYDHTARALKSVNSRLRVGGPSTAQAAWVADFLKHCHDENVPVDFTSTHVYGNDSNTHVLNTTAEIPRDRMVPLAVAKVHQEILHSPYPAMPLFFSEYNASYANEPNVTDTTFMGPWLATTISQCDGLVQSMSSWTFADVFEEQGVPLTPFYGGFGLIAEDRIPKPAFHAFSMLHHLGEQRIPIKNDSVLATRKPDGSLAIALWNYVDALGKWDKYTPQTAHPGPDRTFVVDLQHLPAPANLTVWRVDGTHGNVLAAYDAMGRPATPSREQILALRKAGEASPPEHPQMRENTLTLVVPAQGLVVLTTGTE